MSTFLQLPNNPVNWISIYGHMTSPKPRLLSKLASCLHVYVMHYTSRILNNSKNCAIKINFQLSSVLCWQTL